MQSWLAGSFCQCQYCDVLVTAAMFCAIVCSPSCIVCYAMMMYACFMQASGRPAAVKENSKAEWPAAKAVVLVGDVGFEQYKSASEYFKSKKKPGHAHEFNEASVGFGNLSPLISIIEEQQQQDAQDT